MNEKPRSRWPLRLYAGLLFGVLAVNAAGFTISETLRRLGPVPLGKDITYSTLVTDRDGKLLRPFITRDGYGITAKARAYLGPLMTGEDPPPFKDGLPRYERLKNVPVAKKLETAFEL